MATRIRDLLRTCGESEDPSHEVFCLQMAHTLAAAWHELADQALSQHEELPELRSAVGLLSEALAKRPVPG